MRDRNIRLDETFKRVDRICKDMYNAEKGVSSYIDHMKSIPFSESCKVYGWAHTLRRLIDLRHIRNQLAHNPGTWDAEMCTEEDVEWLQDFYQRLLDGTDPIAQLRKTDEQRPALRSQPVCYEPYKPRRFNAAVLIPIASVIVAGLFLIFGILGGWS